MRNRARPPRAFPKRQTWQALGQAASALLVLLSFAVGVGSQQPMAPSQTPPPQTRQTAPPQAQPASPMDPPLQILQRAQQSIRNVRDYTCLFVKQERVRGQLLPENLTTMRVRNQPFSVHLVWHAPRNMVGQEVCYVAGRNNGQMRVRSSGLLKAVGFVNLDPRDPRALENSRHTITEAGIANLLNELSRGWEGEKRLNKTQVAIGEYAYNERRCDRVETVHVDPHNGHFLFARSIIYFDREHGLPIRIENYDWPRPGGPREPELAECYSYANLRLNIGLGDEAFNY